MEMSYSPKYEILVDFVDFYMFTDSKTKISYLSLHTINIYEGIWEKIVNHTFLIDPSTRCTAMRNFKAFFSQNGLLPDLCIEFDMISLFVTVLT